MQYRYNGPISTDNIDNKEIVWVTGGIYILNPNNKKVKKFIDKKVLIPVDIKEEVKTTKPKEEKK